MIQTKKTKIFSKKHLILTLAAFRAGMSFPPMVFLHTDDADCHDDGNSGDLSQSRSARTIRARRNGDGARPVPTMKLLHITVDDTSRINISQTASVASTRTTTALTMNRENKNTFCIKKNDYLCRKLKLKQRWNQ
jgi:hypothetical protein